MTICNSRKRGHKDIRSVFMWQFALSSRPRALLLLVIVDCKCNSNRDLNCVQFKKDLICVFMFFMSIGITIVFGSSGNSRQFFRIPLRSALAHASFFRPLQGYFQGFFWDSADTWIFWIMAAGVSLLQVFAGEGRGVWWHYIFAQICAKRLAWLTCKNRRRYSREPVTRKSKSGTRTQDAISDGKKYSQR